MKRKNGVLISAMTLAACICSTLGYCNERKASTEVEIVACDKISPSSEVRIEENSFAPQSVTIPAGGAVKWINVSEFSVHTVTSGNPGETDAGSRFDSGLIGIGKSVCLRFRNVGEYPYYCLPHPEMKDALVIVK